MPLSGTFGFGDFSAVWHPPVIQLTRARRTIPAVSRRPLRAMCRRLFLPLLLAAAATIAAAEPRLRLAATWESGVGER